LFLLRNRGNIASRSGSDVGNAGHGGSVVRGRLDFCRGHL
jgi:hypothetical protein